ncbi:YopX family protein [Enterococcus hulanensis]|uniref:YopX family protein n=1 Tax=Enterococcus hulanensis TaxID=2559929 RepID=UPI0010F860BC|nr:YopX family protein [Enterococcus hulanensis]
MLPKFRVWCKNRNEWERDTCYIQQDGILYQRSKGSERLIPILEKNHVVMQSTGLKDKNGVEIFEGDIVVGQQYLTTDLSTPFEIKGLVKYSERNTMFYLDEKSIGHDKFMYSLGSSIYQYEVIGNIYEDKELLEVE